MVQRDDMMHSGRNWLWKLTWAVAVVTPVAASAQTVELAAHANANIQRPSFSPDGDRLSYESNDHESKRVTAYVGRIGGAFEPVHASGAASGLTQGFSTRATGPAVVHELAWSPPAIGKYVYASSANGQDYDLFFAGGRAAVVGPSADGGPVWSPDGRSIVFTSARTGEGDLYKMDLTQLQAPPTQLTHHEGSSEVYATFSPDGQRLAYVAHSQTGDNLWTVGTQGDDAVQITHWPRIQTRPVFSPDGTHIAFYANHEDPERFDLYILRPQHIQGPSLVLRDVVPNSAGPVFTPDGRHIVAVLDDESLFDPIVAVEWARPANTMVLDLGTVGNQDVDVARGTDGTTRIVWTAQGRMTDTDRTFRRLYTSEMPTLP